MENKIKTNNIIVVGDIHIRYTAPSFRKNTFYNELLNKLNQINLLANKYYADVVCLGDFFNSFVEDYFESIAYDLSTVINNWYSLIGNHDSKSVDGNIRGTSFGVLVKSNLLKVINTVDNIDVFHYYNREDYTGKSKNNIALIHDYILPKGTKENFEYKECEENDYKLVISGHYHYPYDVTVGNTRYVNPGSLMRLTVKELELNRTPEVLLVNTVDNSVKHIPLEVSPLSDIVEHTDVQEVNVFESKFVNMLLQSNLEDNNVHNIVDILKQNNVDPNIVSYIKSKVEEI